MKKTSYHNVLPGGRLSIKSQRGAILIGIIATMTLIALLGVGVSYFTGTSIFGELLTTDRSRAYNLAQSGGWYAIPLVKSDLDAGVTTNITALHRRRRGCLFPPHPQRKHRLRMPSEAPWLPDLDGTPIFATKH